MIRTYEIDLDDKLVEDSSKIFESLGSDIDSAIKIFLTQSVLRKGFPFEIAVPDEKNEEIKKENMIESEVVHAISEKSGSVENKNDNQSNPGIPSADEIKNYNADAEIPDSLKIAALKKDLSELENPEKAEKFDSENQKTQETKKTQPQSSSDEKNISGEENQNPDAENSEDEDETTPENLFAQWTVENAGNGNSGAQKISGESEVRS